MVRFGHSAPHLLDAYFGSISSPRNLPYSYFLLPSSYFLLPFIFPQRFPLPSSPLPFLHLVPRTGYYTFILPLPSTVLSLYFYFFILSFLRLLSLISLSSSLPFVFVFVLSLILSFLSKPSTPSTFYLLPCSNLHPPPSTLSHLSFLKLKTLPHSIK
jgi:hypothetical protein